jgi:nitrogenase molybdenum-iron protein alpha/beta subunit
MHTALALGGEVEGLSTLVVGTPECATYSRFVIPQAEGRQGELHWMYVLDAHEVVFGCREGLIQALRKMDQAGAKAVLILVTCVPELIGEDMEGVIHEIQGDLSARLCYVQLGHFKCSSYPSGYWKTLKALGGLMEPAATRDDCINVLGRSPGGQLWNHQPLPWILGALQEAGYSLRFLGAGSSLDDFLEAPDARLNLVVSPYADPLALHMEQEFGIPRFSLHELYHTEEISRAYEEIAALLGLSWENAFRAQREEADLLQEQAAVRLRGIRYVSVNTGAAMALPLAVYLAEAGMEPLLVQLDEFYPNDRQWAKRLTSLGHNPWVCHMVNKEADLPMLEELAPDLCLGGMLSPGGGIASVPRLMDLGGTMGFERTASLLKRIYLALEQPAASMKGGK